MKRTIRQAAAVILLVFISLLALQPNDAAAQTMFLKPKKSDDLRHQNILIMTVRSGQHALFMSELQIESREINAAIRQSKHVPATEIDFYPDIDITLQSTEAIPFRLERSGQLWNEAKAEKTILPDKLAKKLVGLAEGLRTQHYGKLLSWQQATGLLPKKSMFSVTELETGLTFNVQRRAGSDHADVQPLTKEDSRIMKQIYNGKWSWKRKAVLIHSGDAWIAASMNGMPHGGDGIPENGFSGHFCIHFLGSSTHKSDSPDPAHQMMVHKAAGQIKPYFESALPNVLARSFIEAMYHQDHELLLPLAEQMPKEKLASFLNVMESLVSIREQIPPKSKGMARSDELGDTLTTEIRLPVSIHQLNKPRQNVVYTFMFKRESVQSPWHIQDIME
jgi:hypothetical protein